ncbi:response regulator [Tamlana sp. 62-3]|uniref:histidine kinase n=1 Tax=Neotamlana sargassicola TaxID=2883125 RepID=A0A9X1I5I8_9FLAO|nr:ATP-binding protein [Tamlana sargassicola]MCB4808241.1 response regulator [Tamlana sargassicola]
MLQELKDKYHKNNFQYILVDDLGIVLEQDQPILPTIIGEKIQDIHPFFEILTHLLPTTNESFEFSCINLDFNNQEPLVVDVTLKTHNNNNLVIIENLTKHYNNYQLTAQTRNESIINSQILVLKNEYLLEKETFKNNFIANFSHQLRNPITASTIFSDLLINSNLNDEQKNYLEIIQSANKDLKQRIEDILDISKIESGKLILVSKVFNLKELLKNIEVIYNYLASKKGLSFKLEIGEKVPTFVEGDQYRLKQILANLLTNALNYTSKGHIHIKVSHNHTRANKVNLHFEVEDTGCGIAEENLKSIFDRFTKIETGEEQTGVGLGLAIVKYLISEMQGNIKVESKIDKGSTFIFNVSFKASNYTQDQKEALLNNQLPELKQKYNILLVEDSEIIQLSILKILASTGLFFINIISDGEAVIPNLVDQKVDLILLSNTIQGYSASNLSASIRSLSKEYKKTPIIVLSTQGYKDDIKRYKKNGINDVLVKPFDKHKLLESIKKHLK